MSLACAISADSRTADNQDRQARISLDGRINGGAATTPLRMPTMRERLSTIATQLGQYDGPYENGIQLTQNTRRLLFALNTQGGTEC